MEYDAQICDVEKKRLFFGETLVLPKDSGQRAEIDTLGKEQTFVNSPTGSRRATLFTSQYVNNTQRAVRHGVPIEE